MFKTPWELENLARYRREQLEPQGRHPHPITTQTVTTAASRPLARVRRRCGRGLIAAGERLAGQGSHSLQPVPTSSVRIGRLS